MYRQVFQVVFAGKRVSVEMIGTAAHDIVSGQGGHLKLGPTAGELLRVFASGQRGSDQCDPLVLFDATAIVLVLFVHDHSGGAVCMGVQSGRVGAGTFF
jgi:hypothetical protein